MVNTWNNSGDFYVRVRGRNGAFSPAAPFHLEIQLLTGSCSAVGPLTVPRSTTPIAGDYQTIILTDPARISGTPAERAALESRLAAFASRSEVAGVVVDVGADARVAEANAQADANPACPYAKNLVAEAIKEIVDAYRADNPLAYVVIVGDDSVIPFFRYPDNALLANEKNYVPPVRDSSASQASLKLGYVLGQDEYGSLVELSLKSSTLPLPDLAVGRLVETAADATAVLNAYLTTSAGVITPTAQPLVTGYDFLEDAARAVQFELEQGMNQTADELITARDVSPADPVGVVCCSAEGQTVEQPVRPDVSGRALQRQQRAGCRLPDPAAGFGSGQRLGGYVQCDHLQPRLPHGVQHRQRRWYPPGDPGAGLGAGLCPERGDPDRRDRLPVWGYGLYRVQRTALPGVQPAAAHRHRPSLHRPGPGCG